MHAIAERLDRPATRGLLALLLRLRIRQLYKTWVTVRYDRALDVWMFRWPDVIVPTLDAIPTAPWEIERALEGVFFQEYRPKDGDVIVDLGAGLGTEIGMMSRLVGDSGRVIAVEADPRTFSCLQLRVKLNHIANVVPVHAAVVDQAGTVRLSSDGNHLGHHVLAESDQPGAVVPALSLDQLAGDLQLEQIDLLKVNIEGSEDRAFAGMQDSIALVRNVAVSCHDFVGLQTRSSVEAVLKANGFTIRERDAADQREWARSWIYGTREP